MEDEKKPITFGDERYFKTTRFISYFTLINLLVLFSIYLVEQLIDPKGMFFVQTALMVSGIYIASFIFRIKKVLMF